MAALRYSVQDLVDACHGMLASDFDREEVRPLVENLVSLKFSYKLVLGESWENSLLDRFETLILQDSDQ